MNGKEFIAAAIEKAEAVVEGLGSSENPDASGILQDLQKACKDLEGLRNKATLRTKAGTGLTIPVFEAAEALEDAWEESGDGEDLEDVSERAEEFLEAVEVFKGGLRERTVIMT